jgi:hypothetical protein
MDILAFSLLDRSVRHHVQYVFCFVAVDSTPSLVVRFFCAQASAPVRAHGALSYS